MATATQTQSSQTPNFKIIDRLQGVPAIHDSVYAANSIVNSTQITARLYAFAVAIASKSYNIATPVMVRTKPIWESADGIAVATFDRAEATFPYPFKTPTQDLIVVKQLKGVYDNRLLPVYQNLHPILTDINNRISAIAGDVSARAGAPLQTTQDLSRALLVQLRQLGEHGKDLPALLVQNIQKTTTDLREILMAKEQTLGEKGNKLTEYVLDRVKPVVDDVYSYVLGAKVSNV
ncbi:hypothetical protein M231_04392 [Tremella mesenterica]|uniref:Uncharacterized protein n=1 Tax=Tremella mesenterica TaxID=5217 RepID=A0A4Q1BL05_TREME|nr:hypothetical protein M231_04392 [Tremella mesenterica]